MGFWYATVAVLINCNRAQKNHRASKRHIGSVIGRHFSYGRFYWHLHCYRFTGVRFQRRATTLRDALEPPILSEFLILCLVASNLPLVPFAVVVPWQSVFLGFNTLVHFYSNFIYFFNAAHNKAVFHLHFGRLLVFSVAFFQNFSNVPKARQCPLKYDSALSGNRGMIHYLQRVADKNDLISIPENFKLWDECMDSNCK